MKNWEDNWDLTGDPTLAPADVSTMPIQPDEADTALALMAQARCMAINRERGDGTPYIQHVGNHSHPDDHRRIDPSHSIAWLNIEHRGTYWDVSFGSQEFSSSFAAIGRGLTLMDAITDAMNHS